jgi:putative transposase
MYVKPNGEMVYLCRAVDDEGEILEGYITKTRDKKAADLHEEGAETPRLA